MKRKVMREEDSSQYIDTGGREQIFQMGVKFIDGVIDGEFRERFLNLSWNDETKQNILIFFKEKYKELKIAMPFLSLEEYPKIAMNIVGGRLKIHLQGWMNGCEDCFLLGGMWFNKKQYFDLYLCKKDFESNGKEYLIVRYGDGPSQRYLKKSTDCFKFGVKWRTIYSLYRERDSILSINPFELIELGKE